MGDTKSKFEEIKKEEENVLKDVFGDYWVTNLSTAYVPIKDSKYLEEAPEHYSNEKGSLYKMGLERGWNPYQFDAIKRIDRAYKKGQFKEDIEKTQLVLKLMLNNK